MLFLLVITEIIELSNRKGTTLKIDLVVKDMKHFFTKMSPTRTKEYAKTIKTRFSQ